MKKIKKKKKVLEIITKHRKIIVVGGYHSPSGNFDKFIADYDQVLSSINDRYKTHTTVILGDFNVNLYNSNTTRSRAYLNILFSNNFLPLISRASHFSGNNPTCIDHISSRDPSVIESSGLLMYSFNHHLPVLINLNFSIDGNCHRSDRPKVRFNELSIDNFCRDLNNLHDQLVKSDSELSAENSFTFFHEQFRALYDKWFIDTSNEKHENPLVRYAIVQYRVNDIISTKVLERLARDKDIDVVKEAKESLKYRKGKIR